MVGFPKLCEHLPEATGYLENFGDIFWAEGTSIHKPIFAAAAVPPEEVAKKAKVILNFAGTPYADKVARMVHPWWLWYADKANRLSGNLR